MHTSRASCKQPRTLPTPPKTKPLMTVHKGGKSLPVTDAMIGNVLQKLMVA